MEDLRETYANLGIIDESELEINDPVYRVYIPVQVATSLLWVENPKLHDIGGTIQSIVRHGFQDLPKFDKNLPNVSGTKGAIKSGNGRIECLAEMEKDGRYELPRGLGKDKAGAWCVPILVGVDAKSLALARAYAIDANNLTMSGGNFSLSDQAKLWDESLYLDILRKCVEEKEFPVSPDSDDISALINRAERKKRQKEEGVYEITPELLERRDYIVIIFDSELDWNAACDLLKIGTVLDLPNMGGRTIPKKGTGRVITAQKFLAITNALKKGETYEPPPPTKEEESKQDGQ